MSFNKPSGPPASAQQMRRLTELVLSAGHTDFRDARGPLQLNQRQAAGRFTRDEADELITRLEHEAEDEAVSPVQEQPAAPKVSAAQLRLQAVPDHLLAAELQRRGWIVVEP
ncbi:MAG: hypothetical protein ACKOYO_03500 [Actinomycetota bacterium]